MGAPRLTLERKEEIREFVRLNPGMSLKRYSAVLGSSVLSIQKVLRESGEDWDWQGEAKKRQDGVLGPWQARVIQALRSVEPAGLTRNEICSLIGHDKTDWMSNVMADLGKRGLVEVIGRRGGGVLSGKGAKRDRVWSIKGAVAPGTWFEESGTTLPKRVLGELEKMSNGLTAPEVSYKLQMYSKSGKRAVRKVIFDLAQKGQIEEVGKRWAEEGGAPLRVWKLVDSSGKFE